MLLRRRRLLAGAAALAPLLTSTGRATARPSQGRGGDAGTPAEPIPSTAADWADVAQALGRPGNMIRGVYYHTGFPRTDLRVVTRGITVTPALALGSHVSFVRYSDDSFLIMGDLVVTEGELQKTTDALRTRGFMQTAIHKHLPAQNPDVWWTHVHAHGSDPLPLARGLRAALDHTATPPAEKQPATPAPPAGLDTAGIDAALGTKGTAGIGVYTATFIRRETIVDLHRVLPPGLGATTALIFQPLGRGRAALSGDFALIAEEVEDVISALRDGGIDLVELHNHGLTDEPRLFFIHIWAVDDPIRLARALRRVVDLTNVVAAPAA
ncbi:DUF1259 domain-containing protein [Streptomyces sp. NPDC049577]|uniref:DUF1259 domain-containing protein n=1 Tax=Streptomyces sp. NPDC049577 TaxID=3155153 RepID=UPI0034196AA8